MVRPNFMPLANEKNDLLSHVVEEASEVIKVAMKIKRFGWYNHHPDDPGETPNVEKLKDELADLKQVIARLEAAI